MSTLAAAYVVKAAHQLMLAGQWTTAINLLTATHADDLTEHTALALALAEVTVDYDFGRDTDHVSAALAAVPDNSWDVNLLKIRKDYATALSQSGAYDLRDRLLTLIDEAPDDNRRGRANFWAGAIADNVYEQPDLAFEHYEVALKLAEKCDDDLLAGQALRHLGYHARAAGDLVLARNQLERSTELLQKAGHLRPTLAQQSLLAALLRDEGDTAGSRALATEVNRWARQLDVPFIINETEQLMNQPATRTPPEHQH
ncbi:hypothetical protein GCM10009804_63980 [Kribbella hippodromi]|uniref:Tetratricopeptide repeat protein n=1 Tax=Kribbella hippodromi TaxID=434347 RepID=A0ABP4Q3L5_9ACTN